ncbi:histidinol dehydrogenase [Jeotgalibaca arthritidis]|uniref:histidinol dehydrogenase n=1 Tax=Jeotgalibaca arthritidis TaxID=1868794 RepID=A0A6G7KAQ3_9LACT|nr:histidinol dehydrogenase [Jeotgalibaca arthritidis]QII82336.1 histidinol dehydrogenase [Jeotgalibaca arthritidis]
MNAQEFLTLFQKKEVSQSFDYYDDVVAILKEVRENKDEALKTYSQQFDQQTLTSLKVPVEKLKASYDTLEPQVKASLETIKARIEAYETAIKYQDKSLGEFRYVYRPLEKVGVYVPGGTALYPSSVLMTVVPALVAGVSEIHVVTPTFSDNNITFATLYLCGVENVYTVGGAQAIAALAYGTETVPKVDKIVGPGNAYVALAKRLVFGQVGIDMIAGPSEILLYIDETADLDAVVTDVFAQAEHDANARTFVLTESEHLLQQLEEKIQDQLAKQVRADIISLSLKNNHYGIVDKRDNLIAVLNQIAPEHVSIQHQDSAAIIAAINYAGAVFEGHYSPEAIGDYAAGPSHVLPTNRTARFSHGLNVNDFLTSHAVISLTETTYQTIVGAAETIAAKEGLDAHYQSLAIRKGKPND